MLFNRKYPRSKKDKIFLVVTAIIMIILSGVWYLFGAQYEDTREYIVQNNISSSEQLKYIISSPLDFINVMINTLLNNGTDYIYQALGASLGLLTIKVDMGIPTMYLVMLIFSVFLEKSNISLSNWRKVILVLLVIGMVGLIEVAMYLGWTVPGASTIEGIQGRYFLPFAILVFLCCIPKDKYLKFKNTVPIYSILIILLNVLSINTIIEYFI